MARVCIATPTENIPEDSEIRTPLSLMEIVVRSYMNLIRNTVSYKIRFLIQFKNSCEIVIRSYILIISKNFCEIWTCSGGPYGLRIGVVPLYIQKHKVDKAC